MPRSMQDILDHADELAKKLEDYEPSADDEVEVAEYLLRRAAVGRARSERQVADAVGSGAARWSVVETHWRGAWNLGSGGATALRLDD